MYYSKLLSYSEGANTLEYFAVLKKIKTSLFSSCVDVNECDLVSDGPCDENAECVNEVGGFDCGCEDGFTGSGLTCGMYVCCFQHVHTYTHVNTCIYMYVQYIPLCHVHVHFLHTIRILLLHASTHSVCSTCIYSLLIYHRVFQKCSHALLYFHARNMSFISIY